MKKNFPKQGKNSKNFLVEIPQKQNLPFRDSITINHEVLRKASLFLKNIEKKILGGFVQILEPANSGFSHRPVPILHGLKFRTLNIFL